MEKELKRIKSLKIICTVIYSIITLFLIALFIVLFPELYGVEHDAEALVAMLMFFVLFPSAFFYLICAGLSAFGLSKSYKLGRDKDNKYFISFVFAPVITGVASFVAYMCLLF